MNVCVPTGNFGNIFAAYLAKLMGLPISRFICASNTNNILTDFLKTGTYDRNRDFHTTMSPSMDILISSNLERLLYLLAGYERTADYMKQLVEKGVYTVDADVKEKLDSSFVGLYTSEHETASTIKTTFDENGYLCDTHTAVALHCAREYLANTGDKRPLVIASTASPYKFASNVLRSVNGETPDDEFEAVAELNRVSGMPVPAGLASLKEKQVRFDSVIDADAMLSAVYGEMGI